MDFIRIHTGAQVVIYFIIIQNILNFLLAYPPFLNIIAFGIVLFENKIVVSGG